MPGPSTLVGSTFEIVSLGDFEMLTSAFNGLAAITASDGFGNMMRVAFLVGILAFGLKVILTGKFEATPLLASVILYFVMFVPKANVVIVDAYSGAVRNVANVPVGLAAPFSLVSKTGRYFSETFETAFSVIGPSSQFMGAGYLDALSVLVKMRDASVGTANSDTSNSGNFASSLQNYLVSCAFFDIELASDTNSTINPEFLRKSGRMWDNLRTEFINIQTTIYMPGDGVAGQNVSCRDAYLLIGSNYVNSAGWLSGPFDSYLKTVIQQPAGVDVPAGTRLQGALDSIGLASTSAADYAINSVLYNAIRKAEAGYAASNGDMNAAITISQAENQRNVQWTSEKTMFEKVSRPVTAFIEVFLVAATPLMAFAIAAFGVAGISTLGKFMMMHFWVTLWAPTLTIANMYTYTVVNRFIAYMAAQTPPMDPLSINGIDSVTMGLQTQYATGCMLAAATPMLTLMLIYGSSQVASMLAQKMSSADQVDTKVASPPVVSPAAMIQNQSGFTGNPMMGAGYGMTGAGGMSTSLSDISIRGLTSAKQYASEASSAVSDMVGKNYTSGDASNTSIQQRDGKTYTNGRGEQNVLTSSWNAAKQAAQSLNLSTGDTSKFMNALGDTMTGGVSARVGTPEAFGISAGATVNESLVRQWADQRGVNADQAVQMANQMSRDSRTGGSHAATLASMVSKTGEVAAAFDVGQSAQRTDTAAFQKTLSESVKASDSYSAQQSYNQNIASSSTWTPLQLLSNVQGFAQSTGNSAKSVVDGAYSKAFGSDSKRQEFELQKMMNNPLFQQNVASGDRETAAKAWIIASNQDANATQHLMSKIAPVSEGMTQRSNPNESAGLVSQAPAPGTVTAKAALGSNTAGDTAAAVDQKLASAQAKGSQIKPEIDKGIGDNSKANARVLASSKANDGQVDATTKQNDKTFGDVASAVTGQPFTKRLETSGGSTAEAAGRAPTPSVAPQVAPKIPEAKAPTPVSSTTARASDSGKSQQQSSGSDKGTPKDLDSKSPSTAPSTATSAAPAVASTPGGSDAGSPRQRTSGSDQGTSNGSGAKTQTSVPSTATTSTPAVASSPGASESATPRSQSTGTPQANAKSPDAKSQNTAPSSSTPAAPAAASAPGASAGAQGASKRSDAKAPTPAGPVSQGGSDSAKSQSQKDGSRPSQGATSASPMASVNVRPLGESHSADGTALEQYKDKMGSISGDSLVRKALGSAGDALVAAKEKFNSK